MLSGSEFVENDAALFTKFCLRKDKGQGCGQGGQNARRSIFYAGSDALARKDAADKVEHGTFEFEQITVGILNLHALKPHVPMGVFACDFASVLSVPVGAVLTNNEDLVQHVEQVALVYLIVNVCFGNELLVRVNVERVVFKDARPIDKGHVPDMVFVVLKIPQCGCVIIARHRVADGFCARCAIEPYDSCNSRIVADGVPSIQDQLNGVWRKCVV